MYAFVHNSPLSDSDPLGLRRRRPAGLPFFDDIGWDLFSQWLTGDGVTYIKFLDTEYSDYMKANTLLPPQLQQQLENDARRRFAQISYFADNRDSRDFYIQFQVLIENGYFTGYEQLHGTNLNRGGFEVQGPAPRLFVRNGKCVLRYENVLFRWNLLIDPFPATYFGVALLAPFVKAAFWGTPITPTDYDIHITWKSDFEIELLPDGSLKGSGYPYNRPLRAP